MARTTPDVVGDVTTATQTACCAGVMMAMSPTGAWTSSARDQGGAVAEAVVPPLRIQPSINKTYDPSSHRPAVRVMQP
jgi:hypothetical protein